VPSAPLEVAILRCSASPQSAHREEVAKSGNVFLVIGGPFVVSDSTTRVNDLSDDSATEGVGLDRAAQ
jgi:hypothetical protein